MWAWQVRVWIPNSKSHFKQFILCIIVQKKSTSLLSVSEFWWGMQLTDSAAIVDTKLRREGNGETKEDRSKSHSHEHHVIWSLPILQSMIQSARWVHIISPLHTDQKPIVSESYLQISYQWALILLQMADYIVRGYYFSYKSYQKL